MASGDLDNIHRSLRGSMNSFPFFLQSVRIQDFRMFRDAFFSLNFPVTVIAGTNGSGKTSLLLSLAMAYGWPNASSVLHPRRLFPVFQDPSNPDDSYIDNVGHPKFTYDHFIGKETMKNTIDKTNVNWRTYQKLSRPVHVQSIFAMTDHTCRSNVGSFCKRLRQQGDIPPDYLKVLGGILPRPISYQSVQIYANANGQRFAVARRGDVAYSEFNMAAGERMVLHLVDQLSALDNALVLIDEIETALHPSLQARVMRLLMDLSLRRKIQFVVTSHSEAVIDSVPEEARIFLSYSEAEGSQRILVRDIIERALYDRARRRIKIICEDVVAKAILTSVLEPIFRQEKMDYAQIDVGHDTGKDEFPAHVRALDLVGVMPDCLLVLDGDGAAVRDKILQEATQRRGAAPRVLLLPGEQGPEAWLWRCLRRDPALFATTLGLATDVLEQILDGVAGLYASAKEGSEKYKAILETLSEQFGRPPADIARIVARCVIDQPLHPLAVETAPFCGALRDAIQDWRGRQS